MKKFLSIATLCVCLGACAPKFSQTDLDMAQYLASREIVQDWKSTPEKYEFDANITRIEVINMALLMADITKNKNCRGDFSDIPKTDTDCQTMETAADRGLISAQKDTPTATRKARPHDEIIRAEALAILMKTFPDDGAWA